VFEREYATVFKQTLKRGCEEHVCIEIKAA